MTKLSAVVISRKYHFSLNHPIDADGSRDSNDFGGVDNFGHGLNYTLEAFLSGPINQDTGMVVNLRDVDTWIKNVTLEFRDKNLEQTKQLLNIKPTLENLCAYFFKELQKQISLGDVNLEKVKLSLMDSAYAEYGSL